MATHIERLFTFLNFPYTRRKLSQVLLYFLFQQYKYRKHFLINQILSQIIFSFKFYQCSRKMYSSEQKQCNLLIINVMI